VLNLPSNKASVKVLFLDLLIAEANPKADYTRTLPIPVLKALHKKYLAPQKKTKPESKDQKQKTKAPVLVQNAELVYRWHALVLTSHKNTQFVYGTCVKFLASIGRGKYVQPLYKLLFNNGHKGIATALSCFERCRKAKAYQSTVEKKIMVILKMWINYQAQ